MRLNLSDEPVTAELLAESLRRAGTAVIAVNGNSMHPTLQMGWRVYLKPASGRELRVGEIGVFRDEHYLTIHRLVWKVREAAGERLVFRGDYNRARERVDPASVIARVVAVEIPGRRKGMEQVVVLEPDVLSRFYRVAYGLFSLARKIVPRPRRDPPPPGPIGRVARSAFSALERFLSLFLRDRR
jgi:signal peptidase I